MGIQANGWTYFPWASRRVRQVAALYTINEKKDIPKDTINVTLDVKSLYINIPNHEKIEVVKSALERLLGKIIILNINK